MVGTLNRHAAQSLEWDFEIVSNAKEANPVEHIELKISYCLGISLNFEDDCTLILPHILETRTSSKIGLDYTITTISTGRPCASSSRRAEKMREGSRPVGTRSTRRAGVGVF